MRAVSFRQSSSVHGRPRTRPGFGLPRQSGVTFIELIISIVIIGIAASGILLVMDRTTRQSADPLVEQQAIAIAEAYMEEVLNRNFSDPDGGETESCEAGEARATYDDIFDYACIADTNGAVDQKGDAIAGLDAYNIDVAVDGAATLSGVPAARVTVTVTHDHVPGLNIAVTAYRTEY